MNFKIWQKTWQKVGYFNSSQLLPHANSDLSLSLKKIKLTLRPNGREARKLRFVKYLFFEFSHSFTLKGLSHLCFTRYFANILQTAASRTLWKQPPMFLIVAVIKAAENLLINIFAAILWFLDLLLNEFQLSYSKEYCNWSTIAKCIAYSSVLYIFPYFYEKGIQNADIGSGSATK